MIVCDQLSPSVPVKLLLNSSEVCSGTRAVDRILTIVYQMNVALTRDLAAIVKPVTAVAFVLSKLLNQSMIVHL
jgi:hypothetical protein